MKGLILTAALLVASGSAYANSCKVEAGSKKLAGAAMTSFMKKCETDAATACDKSAAEKNCLARPKPASPRNASVTLSEASNRSHDIGSGVV